MPFLELLVLALHLVPAKDRVTPDFEREVLPILRERCFKCHSHASGKTKGGIILDSPKGLREPGESGNPPLDDTRLGASFLLKAVRRETGTPPMPPGKALDPVQISVLTRWVEGGAPWTSSGGFPQTQSSQTRRNGLVTREDRGWWAVQPLGQVNLPREGKDPLDQLVLKKLADNGLEPAPQTDPASWLRRVYFDLIGLPPTPEEVKSFLTNPASDRRQIVVDNLLSRPAFGEKWGRFWLDLVRYADSDGYRADGFRPEAWRYRDWVVQSLNQDVPYDRFIRLQLAADELEPGNRSQLAALGFLRLGPYEYNQRDAAGQWDTILDEITDVTADVVLGLGLACSRCHDHKYDPLPQRDYHALRSYFTPLAWPENIPTDGPSQESSYKKALQVWRQTNQEKVSRLDGMEVSARKKAFESACEKFPPEIQKLLKADPVTLGSRDKQVRDLAWRQVDYEYEHLENYFAAGEPRENWRNLKLELDATRPKPPPVLLTAADISTKAPISGFTRRGKFEAVEPGTLTWLDRLPAPSIQARPESTGRRSALALWMTHPDNPLPPRVIVNRVWAAMFGTGIVATTSDFGTLGEAPSHPEILDLLARDFLVEGWRLKPLIRRIALSETYGRSSTHPAPDACRQKDPGNRLLWRGPFRRLTGEEIRDSMLFASGLLDLKTGGPTVEGKKNRRSLYLPVRRNARDQMMATFDAADGVLSTPGRQNTVTVIQTLLLENGALTNQASQSLAKRCGEQMTDPAISQVFLLTLGRPATGPEISSVTSQATKLGDGPASPDRASLADLAAAILQSNAFLYLD